VIETGIGASTFVYRAAKRDGRIVRGSLTATSREEATSALADAGLWPIELRARSSNEVSAIGRRAMPIAQVAFGLRILADFLASGLPLPRALAALEHLAPPAWRTALPAIRDALRQGKTLGAAFEMSPMGIPTLVIGIVRAGEAGSGVASAVLRAAELTEENAATQAAIRGALAYPCILAAVGALSIALLVGTVLPRFAEILADLGQSLPPTTRLVLGTSDTIDHAAAPATLLLACTMAAWRVWTMSAGGRRRWHALLLVLPFLGDVRRSGAMSRACSALAALLESGVPIATALVHAARATGDAELGSRLLVARERVIHGEPLSRALSAQCAATQTVARLVGAGEESGRLAAMLSHAARLERERAVGRTRVAIRLLEPTLIVLFGGIVALVAAALLQALYSVRPGT
jgi:general secretion pathway protein F